MVTEELVKESLHEVLVPGVMRNLVRMKLVRDVSACLRDGEEQR